MNYETIKKSYEEAQALFEDTETEEYVIRHVAKDLIVPIGDVRAAVMKMREDKCS